MDLTDYGRPLDYNGLFTATQLLRHDYDFLQCFSIGRTVLGRGIMCYLIGSGRPATLFVGAHHAMEYITSMLLLRFTGEICGRYKDGGELNGFDIRKILSTGSVYIIPMLNPDGVEIFLKGAGAAGEMREFVRMASKGNTGSWQANAHGVDLNHNYNAGFETLRKMETADGINGPAPTRYGGAHAESEPETHALCNLCRRVLFGRAFALHSQGEEIYWQYGPRTPKNAREIADILASASGYKLADPEGLASHGGFKDWFINVFARPAFTIEVGTGKNPLPLSEFDNIYEKVREMLLLGLIV